jgi:pimeloyl-ACP methyl ester carboxylesterase
LRKERARRSSPPTCAPFSPTPPSAPSDGKKPLLVLLRGLTPGNYRWSLAAPLDEDTGEPQGSEDFFSSDLNDKTLAKTFGSTPKDVPMMVLYSGNDQYVPEFVDKEKLVGRWRAAREAIGATLEGGIVPGANHNLQDVPASVTEDLVNRVREFLGQIAAGGR